MDNHLATHSTTHQLYSGAACPSCDDVPGRQWVQQKRENPVYCNKAVVLHLDSVSSVPKTRSHCAVFVKVAVLKVSLVRQERWRPSIFIVWHCCLCLLYSSGIAPLDTTVYSPNGHFLQHWNLFICATAPKPFDMGKQKAKIKNLVWLSIINSSHVTQAALFMSESNDPSECIHDKISILFPKTSLISPCLAGMLTFRVKWQKHVWKLNYVSLGLMFVDQKAGNSQEMFYFE